MKKSIPILVACFWVTSFTPLSAEAATYLQDDEGNHYASDASVCANHTYEFVNDNKNSEVLILDQKTKIIKDVFNVTPNMPYLVFPSNAGDVELMVNGFDEDNNLDYTNQETLNLHVKDCGTQTKTVIDEETGEEEKEEYPTREDYADSKIKATLSYDGKKLEVKKPDLEDYYIEYQFVNSSERGHAHAVKFKAKNKVEISDEKQRTIQMRESYTEDGKTKDQYFEIEFYPTGNYSVREVNAFGLTTIDGMNLIDIKMVLWLVFLVVFYNVVTIGYKKQKRRYRRYKIKEMRTKENNAKK